MAEYLFVCGTLRRDVVPGVSAELAALMQGLRFVGMGSLRGQLFDLGEYPGAVIGDHFETKVIGEIYEMPNPREVLDVLDVYEGFVPGELEASLFARMEAPVLLADGNLIECWLYAYNDWVLNGRVIEDGDYVEHLKKLKNPKLGVLPDSQA